MHEPIDRITVNRFSVMGCLSVVSFKSDTRVLANQH